MKFPKVIPEVDTIRLWFYIEGQFDLEGFFRNECKSCIAAFQVDLDVNGEVKRDENGQPCFNCSWEKFRADMRCSWWCKMQITVATSCSKSYWGKDYQRVLQIEYSVAKWHNVSNGVNRGVAPSRIDILKPVFEALNELHISHYYMHSNVLKTWQYVLLNSCQIRRLDLSYNFITEDVQRLISELSICRLNNKEGKPINKDSQTGTVNFGGSRGSLYKAMFYNKEEEQKHFFSQTGIDNSTEQEQNKKVFYKKNKDLFKNVLRFEVQYHSKYFLQHFKAIYRYKKNMDTFNKILNLCRSNYGELLRKFDEQLQQSNIRPESEYSVYEDCMNKLEDLRSFGGLSDSQCANLKLFVEDCFKLGWKRVRARMSQQTFSVKYCKIKKLTSLDLKCICITQLPIMRIMHGDSAGFSWLNSYTIKPSPVFNFVSLNAASANVVAV